MSVNRCYYSLYNQWLTIIYGMNDDILLFYLHLSISFCNTAYLYDGVPSYFIMLVVVCNLHGLLSARIDSYGIIDHLMARASIFLLLTYSAHFYFL